MFDTVLESSRYPVSSKTEAIKVVSNVYARNALLISGFRQVPDDLWNYDLFLPCPLGTFLKPSSKTNQACMKCPPGMFHRILAVGFWVVSVSVILLIVVVVVVVVFFFLARMTLHYFPFLFIGGFYSDSLGYVAEGCKKCPNGSYVSLDKTPGKSVLDCKACPEGKQSTHPSYCLKQSNLIE